MEFSPKAQAVAVCSYCCMGKTLEATACTMHLKPLAKGLKGINPPPDCPFVAGLLLHGPQPPYAKKDDPCSPRLFKKHALAVCAPLAQRGLLYLGTSPPPKACMPSGAWMLGTRLHFQIVDVGFAVKRRAKPWGAAPVPNWCLAPVEGHLCADWSP